MSQFAKGSIARICIPLIIPHNRLKALERTMLRAKFAARMPFVPLSVAAAVAYMVSAAPPSCI